MKTITRKTMLYRTGVEYGDYTMNHVQGCAHGCIYPCYAFLMKKRFGQIHSYNEWCKPFLVSNTLELLEKEIPLLRDKIHSVQLCFSTDPFMYGYDEVAKMSIKAIEMLNKAGIKCTALTKGILPNKLADLSKENEYGITIVSLDEQFRSYYEPFAAPIVQRLNALRKLHESGAKTWVSVEPYPTPNIIDQDLLQIIKEISFVDKIIFGRMNYNTIVTQYKEHKQFYNSCAQTVMNFCENNKIDYHIKKGTITE